MTQSDLEWPRTAVEIVWMTQYDFRWVKSTSASPFWGPLDLDISIYSDSVTSQRETTILWAASHDQPRLPPLTINHGCHLSQSTYGCRLSQSTMVATSHDQLTMDPSQNCERRLPFLHTKLILRGGHRKLIIRGGHRKLIVRGGHRGGSWEAATVFTY